MLLLLLFSLWNATSDSSETFRCCICGNVEKSEPAVVAVWLCCCCCCCCCRFSRMFWHHDVSGTTSRSRVHSCTLSDRSLLPVTTQHHQRRKGVQFHFFFFFRFSYFYATMYIHSSFLSFFSVFCSVTLFRGRRGLNEK